VKVALVAPLLLPGLPAASLPLEQCANTSILIAAIDAIIASSRSIYMYEFTANRALLTGTVARAIP
jgi:hypothetical protein